MEDILEFKRLEKQGADWMRCASKEDLSAFATLLSLNHTRRNVERVVRPYAFMQYCLRNLSDEKAKVHMKFLKNADSHMLRGDEADGEEEEEEEEGEDTHGEGHEVESPRRRLARRIAMIVEWCYSASTTIQEITKELHSLRLAVRGNKDEMICRLLIHVLPPHSSSVSSSPPFPHSDEIDIRQRPRKKCKSDIERNFVRPSCEKVNFHRCSRTGEMVVASSGEERSHHHPLDLRSSLSRSRLLQYAYNFHVLRPDDPPLSTQRLRRHLFPFIEEIHALEQLGEEERTFFFTKQFQ